MSKDEEETSKWLQKLNKTIVDAKPNAKSHKQRKYTESKQVILGHVYIL
jgi:hypothetical protein